MKQPGQIVLFRFPQTDLAQGKPRPALLLGKLPGQFDDWLVCMVSSQIDNRVEGFDEIVQPGDMDFADSGLKVASVIRIGRVAMVSGEILLGAIGEIDGERLRRIRGHLAAWLTERSQ